MSECSYQIDPRPAELGGGWRLRLIEDGEEVGGGVFPLSEYATEYATEDNAEDNAEEAAKWAYDDALAEASAWLASR
ncbi:MAG: hypothetical protein E6Q43_06665 [Dokdonella sp.]|nr:MAG: hypothetical protein E6Q43_06665 [Dokdonella sp.]